MRVSESSSSPAPVLIVGAGPTGLAAACDLRRHGVACRIVDAKRGVTDWSKAFVVVPRTLEVFARLGCADEAIRRGRRMSELSLWSRGERIFGVDMARAGGPFPFLLSLSQSRTERVLEARLGELGGAVEWNTKVTRVDPRSDAVGVTLAGPGGEERVEAEYVLGCDGSRSTCRKAVGADFTGFRLPGAFLLADARLDGPPPDPAEVRGYMTDRGSVIVGALPETDLWRVIVEVPDDDDLTDERLDRIAAAPTLDHLREMIARLGTPVDPRPRDATWLSLFRISQRVVDRLRFGRVFLCGDAAHIHSPAGGQGMNSGIQDAHNLAWKLAAALRGGGEAGETLLDSYHAERHPVVREQVKFTGRLHRIYSLKHPLSIAVRDRAARFLDGFGVVKEAVDAEMSMQTVGYPHSPIVGERRSVVDAVGDDGPIRGVREWAAFARGPGPGAGRRTARSWPPTGRRRCSRRSPTPPTTCCCSRGRILTGKSRPATATSPKP